MFPPPPAVTMHESDRRYTEWYLSQRNHGRRDAARAIEPEVISAACSGTTLVQVVLHPKGVVEVIETPNSPTCGGTPVDHLATEGGDRITTESGDTLILE